MNLKLTPDQTFMRDEARRLLSERADSERLRRAIDAGGFDAALWKTIGAELGWCGVAIPEDASGLGLGVTELVLLAEECGRRLAPVPFWSTACLVVPVIAELGTGKGSQTLLERIVAGEAAALALSAPGKTDPWSSDFPTASHSNETSTLNGTVAAVLDAANAAFILVPAHCDSHLALFAIERGDAVLEPLDGIDLLRPCARLILDDAAATYIDRIDADPFSKSLLTARATLAAEQVGAAQGALDLTLAYIAERVQFGRTIASFQAVKHRCAELTVAISEARSLVYGAAAAMDDGDGDPPEVAAAGALATQVLFRSAEEAIQLHGGVGNTWEYDPHLYLRRAQATAELFGSADEKLEEIANALLGAAA